MSASDENANAVYNFNEACFPFFIFIARASLEFIFKAAAEIRPCFRFTAALIVCIHLTQDQY